MIMDRRHVLQSYNYIINNILQINTSPHNVFTNITIQNILDQLIKNLLPRAEHFKQNKNNFLNSKIPIYNQFGNYTSEIYGLDKAAS